MEWHSGISARLVAVVADKPFGAAIRAIHATHAVISHCAVCSFPIVSLFV